MEMKKNVSTLVEIHKNHSMLFIFSLVLLVGLIASAFYLSFAKTAIVDQQKQLDSDIGSLQTQLDDLKAQNIEGAQFAMQWLAQIEKEEVRWSKVIKSVQDLIPIDSLTQKAKIQFMSYGGSSSGKLTMNAQTAEGSMDPFANVSELISFFNSSSYFKDAYVPSISRGVTQAGNPLLTFVFNVTYEEQVPDAQAGGTVKVPVSPSTDTSVQPLTGDTTQQSSADSAAVKVPRTK